jgi:hypothetical protein
MKRATNSSEFAPGRSSDGTPFAQGDRVRSRRTGRTGTVQREASGQAVLLYIVRWDGGAEEGAARPADLERIEALF